MPFLDALIYGIRDVLAAGVALTRRSTVNFGSGLSAVDDPTNSRINVTLSGGGGGFTAPTGTGVMTVTSGALDAASKPVGTGFYTWMATPSSANLATLITDETGSGALVFGTSPTFKTTMILRNPADTFSYTITPSAITAARALTVPLVVADDTLAVLSLAQTLSNKTLAAPIVTGTVTYQGTNLRILSIPGEVSTSTNTVTTVASFTMNDETLCAFDVVVTAAMRTDLDKGGRWKRSVVYYRTDGGSPTIVGSLESGTDEETDAALDVTIDTDSNDVRVRVTGINSTNFNWTCELRVQETLNT